jgi:hypothetical protein
VEDRTLKTNGPAPPKAPPPIPSNSTEIHPMEQSESRDFIDGRSAIVPEASALVSCFWCERLHPGEHPLAVCHACAATYSTMRSLEMSESYPLSDEPHPLRAAPN